jgi:hypothetical protein
MQEADVLKVKRFTLPVARLNPLCQRLVVQVERLVVAPAPRGQVGQVGEVIGRGALAAVQAIELERVPEGCFRALQIAQRLAHESQVVEVRCLAAAIAGQRPRLQRPLVVLGGRRELARVLVHARDVAQRVAARSMVADCRRELQRTRVVAERALQVAQSVVPGAQIAQDDCLARLIVERAAER